MVPYRKSIANDYSVQETRRVSSRAFSLLETLVVVSIMSILVGAGYMLTGSIKEVRQNVKLPHDVAVLNRAVKLFKIGGGSLAGIRLPGTVLARLKSRASNGIKVPAVHGSKLDYRVTAVLGLGDGNEVAIWDTTAELFKVVAASSVPTDTTPVARFEIDPAASLDETTEQRIAHLELGHVNNWVWDYNDTGVNDPGRTGQPVTQQQGVATSSELQETKLSPPLLSVAPGTYSLANYPLPLSLINPNPAGSSRVLVSRNSGPWTIYNSALPIMPADGVLSYVESLNYDRYLDSDSTAGAYQALKVTLLAGDTFPASLRYTDIGGPLVPGSIMSGPPPPLRLLVTNLNELPDNWENHNVFQMFWTLNGVNPHSGSQRQSGNNTFVNFYPGDDVEVKHSDFLSSSLTLKYLAESKNSNAVKTSVMGERVVGRAKVPLLPPVVTPGDRSLYGEDPVSMLLSSTGGQTPAGARIFYRTDGIDPGDANGEPATPSIAYNGHFLPSASMAPVISIVARVYPPAAYKDWFITSPPVTQNYFLPYGDKNIYAVQKADSNFYALDAKTGVSQIIDNSAPFTPYALALDGPGAMLYYVEFGGSNWRLGRYDIIAKTHAVLGSLGSGRTYNASLQPENLAFYNGCLFYVNRNTDDLVRVTLTGNSIGDATKVADMRDNLLTFDKVGDLAVDDNGWMYFNASDRSYYRYDLNTLSGLKLIGLTELDFEGLAIYHGRLYAGDDSSDELRRLAPSTGGTLSRVMTSPLKRFVDFAAPSPVVATTPNTSLWTIVDKEDGPHLYEIRNYRNPLMAADVEHGIIYYLDGITPKSLKDHGESHIKCMCISNAGMLYFSRDYKIKVLTKDYHRPILRLDISKLVFGDTPHATFVGDVKNALATFTGGIDPDDVITGLTLSPGGHLYGILREAAISGAGSADYLFRLTQTAASMTGPNLPVTLVGRTTSSSSTSADTQDLTFAPDGSLYAADKVSAAIYRLDPDNGAILSTVSAEPGSDYRALTVDPRDYHVIACSYSGTQANKLMEVSGGSGNDDALINLNTLFGHTAVEAMSFFQGPFVLATDPPDLYAAEGTETIYGVDFDTGSVVPFTDAPYRIRALAYDFPNRRLFYLENSGTMSIGSFNLNTSTHQAQGSLTANGLAYKPAELPDNLCYFGGFLWYVPPRTDDLVKVELSPTGAVIAQTRAANLTANTMNFDLTGDLAVAPDGWVYFTTIRYDGQRFCRFRLTTMSSFEVLSGPVLPEAVITTDESLKETWYDALAFRTADSTGARPLFGAYSSAPSPLRIVSTTDGSSTFYKPTIPGVRIIDFSDYHPGSLSATVTRPRPALAFSNLRPAYSYADVGGAFVAGMLPPPTPAPTPSVILANANEVPLSMQNSTHFAVKWTYDGQDPKTATSGVSTGPAFTNGMPPVSVPVDIARWQGPASLPLSVMAVSLKPDVLDDSSRLTTDVPIQKTQLRDPLFAEIVGFLGQRQITIAPNIDTGDCPPGTRIYYTTNETDPGVTTDANGQEIPVTGTLYTGPIDIPALFGVEFVVTARIYPPAGLSKWFTSSVSDYTVPVGLAGGHMDVDTSRQLYPFSRGHTDGHIHAYDKRFNVVGASFFNFRDNNHLKDIPLVVPNGVRFKVIVANADLSPGGRLVINQPYNSLNPGSYIPVTTYDNTLPDALPIYSLDGIPGTTRLTELGLYFDTTVIGAGGLHGTTTGWVRGNKPGRLGEWRNGALTVQLVRVNADGSPAFTTDTSISNGGVQGVATSGLLWETTFFWHHSGGPYN